MAYIFAVSSALGIALNDLCIQLGMRAGRASGSQALIINLISGNIFLLIVLMLVFSYSGLPVINPAGILFFVISGISATFIARLFGYSAIRLIGATRTASLRASETFFTMIIAALLFTDVIALRSVIGSVMLVFGVGFLIYEKNDPSAHTQPAFAGKYSGVCLGIMAGLFFSLGGIFREMGSEQIPSAILGSAVGNLAGLAVNSIFLLAGGQVGSIRNVTTRSAVFFALGGIGNSIGVLAFFLALTSGVAVSEVAALKNTAPVFTMFLTWLATRKVEKFTFKMVICVLVVVTGSVLIIL